LGLALALDFWEGENSDFDMATDQRNPLVTISRITTLTRADC
jgi:hypothetical protein